MSDKSSLFTRQHVFSAVFFLIFIFLLFQMARILSPFSSALIWAVIVTLALHPVYKKVLRLVKGRPGPAAIIMTLGAFLLVIGPTVLFFTALASQAVDIYQSAAAFTQSEEWAGIWNGLKESPVGKLIFGPYLSALDAKGFIMKSLGDFSSDMASHIGSALRNTLLVLINFLIMLFSLFFFFRDGEAYYSRTLEILPFTAEQKQSIMRKLGDTFSAVIKGVLVIALIQGAMTAIGFVIFGVPFAVFWGFFAAIFALLPIGGAALVWIPGAFYLYLTGASLKAILLAVWGLVLVSLPDNFLKPVLIGKRAKLPTFILFIGILGGIKLYGILGILFGPIVVTLLTAFLKIYQDEYGRERTKILP